MASNASRHAAPAPRRSTSAQTVSRHREKMRAQGMRLVQFWELSGLARMKRGDVVTVALQGDLGKPRPAVIVQSDHFNPTHASVTVLR
jgi:hypothetical protein